MTLDFFKWCKYVQCCAVECQVYTPRIECECRSLPWKPPWTFNTLKFIILTILLHKIVIIVRLEFYFFFRYWPGLDPVRHWIFVMQCKCSSVYTVAVVHFRWELHDRAVQPSPYHIGLRDIPLELYLGVTRAPSSTGTCGLSRTKI